MSMDMTAGIHLGGIKEGSAWVKSPLWGGLQGEREENHEEGNGAVERGFRSNAGIPRG